MQSGDLVEEREHREDCDEHGVVDDGVIAAYCEGDHVPSQRHDEKSPLETRQSALEYGNKSTKQGNMVS